MTDLLPFLDPDYEPFSRYSPHSEGSAFTSAKDMLNGESIKTSEMNGAEFFFPGYNEADSKALILSSYDTDCVFTGAFMAKHGSIGPNATFPHVGSYPIPDADLTDIQKTECHGQDWDVTAINDDETFLTIGPTASNWEPSGVLIWPACDAKILVKDISTQDIINDVDFPNIVQIEAGTIKTHSDKGLAIEITDSKVIIHPPSSKVELNIHACHSNFKRKDQSSTPTKEVFHSSTNCVIDIINNATSPGYSTSQFTSLIEKK